MSNFKIRRPLLANGGLLVPEGSTASLNGATLLAGALTLSGCTTMSSSANTFSGTNTFSGVNTLSGCTTYSSSINKFTGKVQLGNTACTMTGMVWGKAQLTVASAAAGSSTAVTSSGFTGAASNAYYSVNAYATTGSFLLMSVAPSALSVGVATLTFFNTTASTAADITASVMWRAVW